ncbi:MAG: hypothetical protein INR69_20935, partial [Mucilaginibacter polytrichastri]|nr:hypothetical protein [Mucilaginibacter polytrichastri]
MWIQVQPVKATIAALRTCVRRIENAVFPDAVTVEESKKITLARKLLSMIGATELDKDIDQASYLNKELDL